MRIRKPDLVVRYKVTKKMPWWAPLGGIRIDTQELNQGRRTFQISGSIRNRSGIAFFWDYDGPTPRIDAEVRAFESGFTAGLRRGERQQEIARAVQQKFKRDG
jgi:hypothetical protein